MENVAEKLFNLLGTKFDNTDIKTLDSKGKETMDMEQIEMFSFDFEASGRNYGPVVILLSSDNNLELYYGDNTSKTLDRDAKKKWENLVEHLSTFARTNRQGFSLKHITDLRYDLSNIADITESYKNIFEGYYGTSKTSYNPQGKAKIIIKHSKKLGEEDARFRNISSLFIENADGERFKLPFTKLAGARAMARHVTEGGNPYDLFGLHISEMVKDINTLGGFMRRSKAYEELEEAAGLIETGRNHYQSLRKGLKQISGKRGYHTYKEGWEPSEITEQDNDIDSIRKLFTERSVNSKVEDALPLLAKLQKLAEQQVEEDLKEYCRTCKGTGTTEDGDPCDSCNGTGKIEESNIEWPEEVKSKEFPGDTHPDQDDWGDDEMDEAKEFESWANRVVEGTWEIPETPGQAKALGRFLSTAQPLGIDAINAIEGLEDVIGDDDLYDRLEAAAQKNPDQDARPIVVKWIRRVVKHSEFRNPASVKYLRTAIQGVKESLNSDLDADEEKHLNASVNKDLDKYKKDKKVLPTETRESDEMKELSEYMDDVEGTTSNEQVTESKEEPIEDQVDLKALMERTNYLLKK